MFPYFNKDSRPESEGVLLSILVIAVLFSVILPGRVEAQNLHMLSNGHVCKTDDFFREMGPKHAAWLERHRSSHPPISKYSTPPEIGDERPFNVWEEVWEEHTFRLMDKTSRYYMWVDITELTDDSEFSPNEFRARMMESTPASSINPGAGIIVNNEAIFGDPPDFDLDGITDILIYDMADAGGYVTGWDLVDDPPEGVGNRADVLYLSSEMTVAAMAEVAAHEFTHLIHLNYGGDANFIMEGIAEYGVILNGFGHEWEFEYPQEVYTYATSEGLESIFEYQAPLFKWRFLEGLDYERGNHFFGYAAEQFGPEAIGDLLRYEESFGGDGMAAALEARGENLSDLIRNFHAANLISDKDVDSRFGHGVASRQALVFPPTLIIDGESATSTIDTSLPVSPGAAFYSVWTNIADVTLNLDAPGYEGICAAFPDKCEVTKQSKRRPFQVLIAGERLDGNMEFWDVVASDDPYFFSGRFSKLSAVITHTDPDSYNPVTWPEGNPIASYSLNWTPLSQATNITAIDQPDDSFGFEAVYPNPIGSDGTISFTTLESGRITISAFDLLGRKVADVVEGHVSVGTHSRLIEMNALPAGTYLLRLTQGSRQETMLIQKVRGF